MKLKELTQDEFNTFSNSFSIKSPYQTKSFGIAKKLENYTPYYVGLMDESTIIAATMVLVKQIGSFKYGYSPRGFLIDYSNIELLKIFTKEVKKYFSDKAVVAIKLSPLIIKNVYDKNYKPKYSTNYYNFIFESLKDLGYRHLGYNNFFEALNPRFEAVLNIQNDYYKLFENMSKQFQTKTRSAENTGVRIFKGSYAGLEDFVKLTSNEKILPYYQCLYNSFGKNIELFYAKLDSSVHLKQSQSIFVNEESLNAKVNELVLKNKGESNHNLINKKIEADKRLNSYHEKLLKSINIMNVNPKGLIIAGVIIVKQTDTISIIAEGYDKNYKSFNAKHLLIWKLIEKYSQEGYKFFNLGGITNNIQDNKYKGLNQFKLGFNSEVYEYMGDLELITNKPLYIMYKNTSSIFKNK